jgi:hypothetical protein
MKLSESPYRTTPLWSEDDWEYMSNDLDVDLYNGKPVSGYALHTESEVQAKPRKIASPKPAITEEQKEEKRRQEKLRQAELEHERSLRDMDALAKRSGDDRMWFWRHLGNQLLKLNITLDQIDEEQYYAANTDGQVCRVVHDDDVSHPAMAANETATKIVLFFAQQKLTRINE